MSRLRFLALLSSVISCGLMAHSAIGQTIFEDDFDDNAAGWTFESLTGNFGITGSDVVFGYDYSTVGIPEAPNTPPGQASNRGVRLRTNTTGLTTDQAAIYLEDDDFSGKYTVQVDLWLNWPPDPQAIGTTIHAGLYAGDAFPGDESANEPIQRGAGLIVSSDGDCSNCDYILLKNQFELDTFSGQYSVRDFGFGNQPGYDNTDENTNPLNGDVFSLPGIFPSFDIDAATGGAQSAGVQQPAGAVGFQWVTLTAEVDPTAVGNGPNASDLGIATFTVTNAATGESVVIGTVDNSQPDILDDDMDGDECDTGAGSEDICVNLNDPLAGDVPVDLEGRISLALIDFFAGAGSNTNLSFALFDNLQVFATEAGLPGDFNNDGAVDAVDYVVWRDNLGGDEAVLNGNGDGSGGVDSGDYLVWKNGFGSSAASAASLASTPVPEPNTLAMGAAVVLLASVIRRRTSTLR